jgi:hypothetical protein
VDSVRLKTLSSGATSASLVLLVLLAAFCGLTRWGRTFPALLDKSWIVLRSGTIMTAEERRLQLYEPTYPVVLYLRDSTPEDAVILLPPGKFIDEHAPATYPLLASPSSVYNFIYPRVPVHWGDPSPWKDRVNHVLVWEYWGLNLVEPGAPRTEENRTGLYPWPAGRSLSW